MDEKPEVTRMGLLGMQVCVPARWSDAEVEAFANAKNPTGIESKWAIRRQGDEALAGDPERVPCASRPGCIHITLGC